MYVWTEGVPDGVCVCVLQGPAGVTWTKHLGCVCMHACHLDLKAMSFSDDVIVPGLATV